MNTLRTAAIVGPLVWIIQIAVDLTFVYSACSTGKVWMLVVVNVVAMLFAAGGSLMAFRLRPVEPFRATVVTTLDAIFALLIFAQMLPLLLFRGCA